MPTSTIDRSAPTPSRPSAELPIKSQLTQVKAGLPSTADNQCPSDVDPRHDTVHYWVDAVQAPQTPQKGACQLTYASYFSPWAPINKIPRRGPCKLQGAFLRHRRYCTHLYSIKTPHPWWECFSLLPSFLVGLRPWYEGSSYC